MINQELKELLLTIPNSKQEELKDFDINKLLILEKQRLGFKKEDLVFISAGDFSKYYWCEMQTYFSLIKNESDKFSGYLQDKIEYSIKLNKLNKLPKTNEELLDIGNEINLEDIFQLLKREEYQNIITNEDITNAKEELDKCKLQKERGHFLETIHAKKYPQIHWIVKYKDFIFTCAPDGIQKNFVYEFKSSKNRYFSKQSIKKAKLQADIYAICFNKKTKIIEQLIVSESKIETITEEVNIDEVNSIIDQIRALIKGKLPAPPKEEFKCQSCEYKNKCKIKIIQK